MAAYMNKVLPLAIVILTAAFAVAARDARASDRVDVALVLVSDVSRSIDDREYAIEKQGYAAAFRDKRVLNAIFTGSTHSIAVSYVEFAGRDEVNQVVGWTVIRDEETGAAFSDQLLKTARSFSGVTSISAGIDFAVRSLSGLRLKAARRVIDVAGDGVNNAGRDADKARDDAIAAGITINGLAIRNDNPAQGFGHVQPPGGLLGYFRENVAGGPENFVIEVLNLKAFGDSIAHKLAIEIAANSSRASRRGHS
jgi:Protein of unknown function (DUF1194)